MNPFALVGIFAAVYFLTKNQFGSGSGGGSTEPSVDQMRSALINWVNQNITDSDYTKRLAIEAFNEMTNSELRVAWYWVFKRQQIQPDLQNLSVKYNLFT